MSKVIFEFDEDEDRIEIENIMKRDNFIYALEKIREYVDIEEINMRLEGYKEHAKFLLGDRY